MKNSDVTKDASFWDKRFRYTEMGSSLKTEVVAGLTTFLAMAYILIVNSGMFASLGSVSFDAMYVTTALSAIIGTVLIGLLSNLPLAQAPGMGLNAFFVYTVCMTLGFSYANALVFVLLDGIIFVLLTATGLRKIIFDAIPHVVKAAIPAGHCLFGTAGRKAGYPERIDRRYAGVLQSSRRSRMGRGHAAYSCGVLPPAYSRTVTQKG